MPVVRVKEGLLEGFQEDKIFKFFGIPFASPPVGQLRWRPPQPPDAWEGTRKATSFGPIAYQIRPPEQMDYERIPLQSEDCLYLNIWTPEISRSGKLPVLVWIHGGGFMTGSGSKKECDGTVLAQHGAVVVTFNYRLGPLGNLLVPGPEPGTQDDPKCNYGIMDQIAALQWVQNNISCFGGNPDNVTIFGVSAGAMSAALLCSSPRAEGLFKKAICQSGGLLAPPREIPYETALRDGFEFQKALGVSGIEEMRHIHPERLMQAAAALAGKDEQPAKLRFAPVLDGIVVRDQEKTLKEKSRIPLIIGSNKDEATFFLHLMPPITTDNYRQLVFKDFGNRASGVLERFPANSAEEARKNFLYLHTCALFTIPVYELARKLSNLGGEVYVYRFSRLSPKNIASGTGASHGEEAPYIFGHVKDTAQYAELDRNLSETMMQYWLNFCKTGNPNSPLLPEWPRFIPGAEQYLEFNDRLSIRNYAEEAWFGSPFIDSM